MKLMKLLRIGVFAIILFLLGVFTSIFLIKYTSSFRNWLLESEYIATQSNSPVFSKPINTSTANKYIGWFLESPLVSNGKDPLLGFYLERDIIDSLIRKYDKTDASSKRRVDGFQLYLAKRVNEIADTVYSCVWLPAWYRTDSSGLYVKENLIDDGYVMDNSSSCPNYCPIKNNYPFN